MKIAIKIIGALLLTGMMACAGPDAGTNAAKIKVLVVTGGHQFRTNAFFQMLSDNAEITYTHATQEKAAEAYDRDDLSTYNVVLLYDSPTQMTEAQRANFLALFDKGIGVVVLHHA